MTDRENATQLLPLARSWLRAPKLQISSQAFHGGDYDPAQRAYVLTCKQGSKPSTLECILAADVRSPIVNPCLVLKNWGRAGVELTVDAQRLEQGKQFRLGRHHTLEGSDLVIWLEQESSKPLNITLSPVNQSSP